MSDIAIRVEGLGKRYRVTARRIRRPRTLQEAVATALKRPLQNLRNLRGLTSFRDGETDVSWALSNVSFEVRRGEIVGIIGRNGAGKSTLLKVLSRITSPTTGWAELFGRMGSLLEVGTGFHQELSGRDNIYLNGSILGMDRAAITRRFDEIVEFSGVGPFIDTPVKRYSSGMYLRLAFAVAAHLDAEILLVDEVLAVGDAEFQRKCLGKVHDIARSGGRTVIFVSHNMDAILSLCPTAMLLHDGSTAGIQSAEAAVRAHLSTAPPATALASVSSPRPSSAQHAFSALEIAGDDGHANVVRCGGRASFRVCVTGADGTRNLECGIAITDLRGRRVALLHSRYQAALNVTGSAHMEFACEVDRMMLSPGTYYVDLLLADGLVMIDMIEQAGHFDVTFADVFGSGSLPRQEQGMALLEAKWAVH